jgi:hypothetical protein
MNIVKRLEKAAKQRGVEIIDKGNGHYHLVGPLLVNYWPLSKKMTAYVAGTIKGPGRINPEQAIAMCFKTPKKVNGLKADRKKHYRPEKEILFVKIKNCHWCDIELTIETATMEHIVPLDAGGLNNFNNYTLACEPCNTKRGNKMPELKGEQK